MAQEPSSIARHDDGYYQGGRTPSASDQWHFVDYLRLLSKRRWTGIPVFLLVVVGVALMTYTATPVYEARTQLLIEAETQNVVTFQEVVEQERTTVEYYTTQYMILQSRALARTTIEKLKLWTHPELVGPPAEDKAAQAAAESERSASGVMSRALRMVEGAVTRLLGPQRADATFNAPKNSESAAPDETTAQSLAIQTFLSHLTVTPVRNSRLVDVKYRSTNPQLAASVANALSQAYVDRTLEFKLSASKEAADWLANQLSSQKEKVEESEKALQSYREKNTALSTEDAQIVEKLSHLNAMLTQTKTDRLQKELMYKQVVSHQGDRETLQTFPAIAATPAVQRLKGELSDLQRDEARYSKDFGDKWPALTAVRTAIKATEAKLDAEIENGIKLIYNDVEAARAQEDSLARAIDAQKADALARNREAIGYEALQREAASNRQIFDTLMQRAKETNISSQLRTNNIRVADQATPPTSPVWPDTKRNLLFAIMGGLAIAIAASFAAEYLDNKLKSPEEIRDDLGLRCLGLVPKVLAKTPATPLVNNGVPAVFAEAFRAVRTNVIFSLEHGVSAGTGRTLVVTSTAPAEGKTVVTANLAVSLAMTGQRVVLIDADMRRARQHEIFSRRQAPGLSDLVMGTVKASDAITKTDISGLWLLPSGHLPANPTELLSSLRFRNVLDALTQQVDWVIIDSPPAMAVIDASVIAHTVGGVLFVVAAEKTSRPAAIKALEQLDAAKANFVGVVLNRVDVDRNAFYYSPYYRQDYGQYYSRSA